MMIDLLRGACFIFLLSLYVPVLAQNEKQIIASIKTTSFKKDTLYAEDFGARPDGITLNTLAINTAITACHTRGGGVVVMRKGIWLTGPVVLRSNVNLCLQANALLLFSSDFSHYPLVKGSYEGLTQMRNQSPISAADASNIAITGEGMVDGSGEAWRMVSKDITAEKEWKRLVASGGILNAAGTVWYPSTASLQGANTVNPGFILPERDSLFYLVVKDFLRPNLLVFTRCAKILLQGVTFQNSPNWNIHLLQSSDIVVDHITAANPVNGQNSDGIDIESCSRVLVQYSSFDVGDDGICIKSGRDKEGRLRGMPAKDVVITGCRVFHAHGGFVIGSEMSGGVKNIYVNNCSFIGTDVGLRFKSRRGRGGIVEDVFINDIFMDRILKEAISFDIFYPKPGATEAEIAAMQELKVPVDESTPLFKNIFIRDVVCAGAAKAIFVRGLSEMPVQHIEIAHSVFHTTQGVDIQDGSYITCKNLFFKCIQTDPLISIKHASHLIFEDIDFTPIQRFIHTAGTNTDIKVASYNKEKVLKKE